MISQNERYIEIPGPAGTLQAILRSEPATPERDPDSPIVIICHPHPQHGGTMQNKVVTTVSRAAADMGWDSLRFNYRGVGESEGQYGEFFGECDDLRSVIGWVRDQNPEKRLHLAGFSFGSGIASTVVGEFDQFASLTLVAPPVEKYDFQVQNSRFDCPVYVVQGSADELVDYQAVERWCKRVDPVPEFLMLMEADHFFHRRLVELREQLVLRWSRKFKHPK